MTRAHTLATPTHGRYLTDAPEHGRPAGLIVGFHGYGETVEAQLDRQRGIPGALDWLLVSIQGLHRFYNRRSEEIVASWMTRQDRELAIADNLAFVNAVLDEVMRESGIRAPLVFAGFSQGVAMAYRAACATAHPIAGIISAGGDIPPELDRDALARIPAAILARGSKDEWYSSSKWNADQSRLRDAGVEV
jgi:predicted esterase